MTLAELRKDSQRFQGSRVVIKNVAKKAKFNNFVLQKDLIRFSAHSAVNLTLSIYIKVHKALYPIATIRYGLPQAGRVSLRIFNLLGEEVATLVGDEQRAAGYHVAIWNGRGKNGVSVASGLYLYWMRAGSFMMVKKMAVIQ